MITDYRPITGFPGYKVGRDGSIWSCLSKNGRGPTVEWRLVKPNRSQKYSRVSLYRDGVITIRFVHIIVLEEFVGPCPPGQQACHDPDRDTRNNAVSNLRWDTPKNNQADRVRHGTAPRGTNNPAAKLTQEKADEIRLARSSGEKLVSIANRFGVTFGTVWKICEGRIWRTSHGQEKVGSRSSF